MPDEDSAGSDSPEPIVVSRNLEDVRRTLAETAKRMEAFYASIEPQLAKMRAAQRQLDEALRPMREMAASFRHADFGLEPTTVEAFKSIADASFRLVLKDIDRLNHDLAIRPVAFAEAVDAMRVDLQPIVAEAIRTSAASPNVEALEAAAADVVDRVANAPPAAEAEDGLAHAERGIAEAARDHGLTIGQALMILVAIAIAVAYHVRAAGQGATLERIADDVGEIKDAIGTVEDPPVGRPAVPDTTDPATDSGAEEAPDSTGDAVPDSTAEAHPDSTTS